jgi:hypothetical protein
MSRTAHCAPSRTDNRWRSPAEHSGNGILTAETARAFRAAAARKAPNRRAETDTASANPRKCRGLSPTRKITEFARTRWWWTQSHKTSLPRGEFPASRERTGILSHFGLFARFLPFASDGFCSLFHRNSLLADAGNFQRRFAAEQGFQIKRSGTSRGPAKSLRLVAGPCG